MLRISNRLLRLRSLQTMTIIKENQNDTGIMTFTFRFIKREDMPYPNYTEEEIYKIVDVLGRARIKRYLGFVRNRRR